MLRKLRAFHEKKKKGQSTVEYILLVAGVIAVLIVFLGPNGAFKKKYDQALNEGTEGMANMAKRLSASHDSGNGEI